jgi:ribosome biogenesis GTPase
VLTKSDLILDAASFVADAESIGFGVPVIVASSVTGAGVEDVRARVPVGRTGALLGSSGVGKSTLLNRLLGREHLRTAETQENGRGRHTTTHRELVALPGGGLIIDTPGMRELQLWSDGSGLGDTFADIARLAEECRFDDCAHDAEPGCAVKSAVESGALDAERLESFHKLRRELERLERLTDPLAAAERKRQEKSMMRLGRTHIRNKYR